MKVTKTILLSRHGSTIYNDTDLLQGISDIPLSDRGIKESEQLAERLKDEKIDIIYYTPMMRSKNTAEIANKYHQAPMECIDSFLEMSMGDNEGVVWTEFVKKNPDFYARWATDPDVGMPGGESYTQLFNRVKEGVDYVLSSSYSRVLIVAHAMVNRAILGHLLEMDPMPSRRFRSKNCSLAKLEIFDSPSGPYAVVDSWNNYSHISHFSTGV